MSRFMETDDSCYINLDHVARIAPKDPEQAGSTKTILWLLQGQDGTVLGEITTDWSVLGALDAVIVPAPALLVATALYTNVNPDAPPEMGDIECETRAVIAFQIGTDGRSKPVLFGCADWLDQQTIFLHLPNGAVTAENGATYTSLKEAMEAELASEQERWRWRQEGVRTGE
jgi:hypothetical protein